MSDKATHTPVPWRIDYDPERSPNIWIQAEKNSGIAKIEVCDYGDGQGHRLTAEDFSNAEFIRLACNSHDDLLAALKDVIASASGMPKSCGHPYTCTCTMENARLAIAKAEGRS